MAGKRLSWLDVVNCYFTLESAERKASHVALALLGKLRPLGAGGAGRDGVKRWRALISKSLDNALEKWRKATKAGRVEAAFAADWVPFDFSTMAAMRPTIDEANSHVPRMCLASPVL